MQKGGCSGPKAWRWAKQSWGWAVCGSREGAVRHWRCHTHRHTDRYIFIYICLYPIPPMRATAYTSSPPPADSRQRFGMDAPTPSRRPRMALTCLQAKVWKERMRPACCIRFPAGCTPPLTSIHRDRPRMSWPVPGVRLPMHSRASAQEYFPLHPTPLVAGCQSQNIGWETGNHGGDGSRRLCRRRQMAADE